MRAASGPQGGKLEQFVDRPLVVGVAAVFAGKYRAVLVDQDVGRQPEAAPRGVRRRFGRQPWALGAPHHPQPGLGVKQHELTQTVEG